MDLIEKCLLMSASCLFSVYLCIAANTPVSMDQKQNQDKEHLLKCEKEYVSARNALLHTYHTVFSQVSNGTQRRKIIDALILQIGLSVSSLYIAVLTGDIEIVSSYAKEGVLKAQLNGRDCLGKTLLHNAVELKRYDIACLLLAAGANPSAPDNFGRTSRDGARECGHTELVSLLEHAKTGS